MNRMNGKVCIVTGAGRGIGKGIARRLIREGGKVLICDINAELLDETVAELAIDGEIAGSVTDVGNREQVQAMVDGVVARWGRIDVMVNNAGIARANAFLDITDSDWDRIMNTNLRGTFLCSQFAARQMVAHGTAGSIVNIASTNGTRGQATLADYGASKAGIINLTQTCALELGSYGIRVNAVCPGTIWSEMSAGTGWDDEIWNEIRSATAIGRFGTPDDIAAAVAYVASDEAGFVTGSFMVVDGGLTARQLNLKSHQIVKRKQDE